MATCFSDRGIQYSQRKPLGKKKEQGFAPSLTFRFRTSPKTCLSTFRTSLNTCPNCPVHSKDLHPPCPVHSYAAEVAVS